MRSGSCALGAMVLLAGMLLAAPVLAGDLNPPPGAPASTMKTLDQIPPTWDRMLPADDGPLVNNVPDPCNSSRFKCVLGGAAVLDKETGLVWDKSPDSSPQWANAQGFCFQRTVGGRRGWRLPTVEELASLTDPNASKPALPAGHPFTNIQSWNYWSATTYAPDTTQAWVVWFDYYSFAPEAKPKTEYIYVWCVRGGRGVDGQ
jgi:uncharacterized protein DUF1566